MATPAPIRYSSTTEVALWLVTLADVLKQAASRAGVDDARLPHEMAHRIEMEALAMAEYLERQNPSGSRR